MSPLPVLARPLSAHPRCGSRRRDAGVQGVLPLWAALRSQRRARCSSAFLIADFNYTL